VGPPALKKKQSKKSKKSKKPKNVSETDASRMGYSRAFGPDQWVTSIWRHGYWWHVDLGVGVKKDKNPQSGEERGIP